MANSKDAADAANEDLIENLRRVIADAEDLMGATADETGERLEQLRKRTRENLERARSQLHDVEDRVRVQAQRAAAVTNEYVRENPWSSVGAAAAAGIVLGVLLSRR